MPTNLADVASSLRPYGLNGVHPLPHGKVVLRFSGPHHARTIDIERQPDISREEWVKVTVWHAPGPKVEERRVLPVNGLGAALAALLDGLA